MSQLLAERYAIQGESMYYGVFNQDCKKHDGSLLLIGVNTSLPKDQCGEIATEIELICSTEEEEGQQIVNVKRYREARAVRWPQTVSRCCR